eukprot:GHVT01021109.1.p1 GENE.GHVT01021109.1~~GHVT01021109.1.p1  ORF type:complete len:314 (-),score=41.97 GHVT01021109.1:662-1603(-)
MTNIQAPCCSKNFFQAQEATFHWSADSKTLLLVTHTDADVSGKSYYGSNNVYLLRTEGSCDTIHLVTAEQGPIHDLKWNPKHSEFLICKGPMPPKLELCDGRTGNAKTSFGNVRRNTLRWNRFGRFFALGGFGNLSGDLEFWDKNKGKTIGVTKAPMCVICEFAPDGRHFLAATTSPRLRVDNCIKVLKHNGELVTKLDFTELYSVAWRPIPESTFEDRAASPLRSADGSATSSASTSQPPDVYRPRGCTGQFAARLRAERGAPTVATTVKPGGSSRLPGVPPGFSPPEAKSKSALKNERRKKARDNKKEEGS